MIQMSRVIENCIVQVRNISFSFKFWFMSVSKSKIEHNFRPLQVLKMPKNSEPPPLDPTPLFHPLHSLGCFTIDEDSGGYILLTFRTGGGIHRRRSWGIRGFIPGPFLTFFDMGDGIQIHPPSLPQFLSW